VPMCPKSQSQKCNGKYLVSVITKLQFAVTSGSTGLLDRDKSVVSCSFFVFFSQLFVLQLHCFQKFGVCLLLNIYLQTQLYEAFKQATQMQFS
jgi:hypothetical protein